MTDLLALAARVEAATGADRELDCLIAVAAAGYFPLPPRWEGGPVRYGYLDADGVEVLPGQGGDQLVKRYTASLDAALTLVPEGFSWSLYDIVGKPESVRMFDAAADVLVSAATPALALTAACLRARAQGAEA